jgi:hypothetical protein
MIALMSASRTDSSLYDAAVAVSTAACAMLHTSTMAVLAFSIEDELCVKKVSASARLALRASI